jgi:hypothetical protein
MPSSGAAPLGAALVEACSQRLGCLTAQGRVPIERDRQAAGSPPS